MTSISGSPPPPPPRPPAPARVGQADLLSRHAPILRLDRRELFRPTAVDGYVQVSTLCDRRGELIAEPSIADLDGRWSEQTFVQMVNDNERRTVVRSEARRAARKLLTARLGQVGLIGRLVDVLFQLSLWMRPTTPRLTTAAALAKVERWGLQERPICYGRVVRAGAWVVLHYSYFYVMNDWRTGYDGMNDHEADWEQAWVFLDADDLSPVWVAVSNHDHRGADLRRHWSDPELMTVDERPVLFAAAGSHAMFFRPGDYVTRVDVPALRWLLRAQAWFHGVLKVDDDADRGVGPRFGVAFLDAARGDGEVVQDFEIRALAGQPWAETFRGLWGFDTGDRTHTERGPSGPKFDRSGEVRDSWADPLGFAGLHGTPPPSAAAARVNLARVEATIEGLDGAIEQCERLVPLAQQAGSAAETAGASQQLTNLLRQRCELLDLRARIRSGHAHNSGVRDHLERPPVPLAVPETEGWILAGWAALSMPFVFGALAAAVVFDGINVWWTLFAVVCVSLVMEHLVRRRFEAVLRLLVIESAVALVLFFATGLLLSASQWAIALLLLGVAVAILVMNVGELRAVVRYRGAARSRRSEVDPSADGLTTTEPAAASADGVLATQTHPMPAPLPIPGTRQQG